MSLSNSAMVMAALALCLGCSDSRSTDHPSPPEPCDVRPLSAPDGATIIDVLGTETLITHSGARSDPEPIGPGRGGHLRVGPCGTAGLVFSDPNALLYRAVDEDGSSSTTRVGPAPGGGAPRAALYYTSDCDPYVVRVFDGRLLELRPDPAAPGAEWLAEEISLEGVVDGSLSVLVMLARVGPAGQPHILMYTGGAESGLVHVTRGAGGWQAATIDGASAVELGGGAVGSTRLDFAADAVGHLHLAFANDRHLTYGEWDGLTFARTIVAERADFAAEPAWGLSIDLDLDGRPAIAAANAQRVATGSLCRTDLRLYRRMDDGTWPVEVIANRSDGYAGGDGDQFTGQRPLLRFDAVGRPHIVFNDISSWHADGEHTGPLFGVNDTVAGQLRHAVRDEAGWRVSVLYTQPGQAESHNPLHDLAAPSVAHRADGRLIAVGVARTIGGPTLAYDLEVTIERSLVWIDARVQ